MTGTGLAAHTDLDGRFKISGLAPGWYRLVARCEGYREQEREVELLDGVTEAEVSFSLERWPDLLATWWSRRAGTRSTRRRRRCGRR